MPLVRKGLFALVALFAYAVLPAAYFVAERRLVLEQFEATHRLYAMEDAIRVSELAVSDAVFGLAQLPIGADALPVVRVEVAHALEVVENAFRRHEETSPAMIAKSRAARQAFEAVREDRSPANVLELREALRTLARELRQQGAAVVRQRVALVADYGARHDRATIVALALGLAGLVVFAAVATGFFWRLAGDLDKLRVRAEQIVSGYRGEPLKVTRHDEVGILMQAVNRMGTALAAREREIAVAHEQQVHREKMAAIGSIATNVAHEIGNPLAIIAAIAQDIAARQSLGECRGCQPQVVLEQTRRIAELTRQMADFAAAPGEQAGPVDANRVAQGVADLMRFDHRFRGARIELDLAPELPPLEAPPGHLIEILMNVLQFGVEADPARKPGRIVIETASAHPEIRIRVLFDRPPAAAPDVAAPAPASARLERARRLVAELNGRLEALGGPQGGFEIAIGPRRAAATVKA